MRIVKFLNKTVKNQLFRAVCAVIAGVAALPLASAAEPQHGIAMYGEPALPADFTHLPYANPDAPQGGAIRLAEPGGFDSLNPWVLKGNPAWPILFQPNLVAETLMYKSIDEPFTLYGLLAETVEADETRSWVEFTLNPAAKFSDGSPVTIEDVIWSYETLGTQGHPRYASGWSKVEKMEQTGERSIKFTFKVPDRELVMLMGMRPILKKAQWEGKDFSQSSLDVPIGSAPYYIDEVSAGRSVTFKKNPDYWGKDLAINRGMNNFDEIRYDFYGDADAMFEAFKAGEFDIWRELSALSWETQYDFPRAQKGDVVQSEIPHNRPSGIMGLVMNTRKPMFQDWRVRQALIEAFNFQFINNTLNGGKEPRITSYFANSDLAMSDGPAQGRTLELLKPFADDLLPGAIEGYSLPEGSERASDRAGIRRAIQLMEEAGWTIQDGEMKNAKGEVFSFEILLNQSGTAMRTASEVQQFVNIYAEALRNLGIRAKVTVLDSAQFVQRTNNYSFDVTWFERALSLSPGNEQYLYWGKNGIQQPGSRNLMGMDSPAAEAMINEMVNSKTPEDFEAAVKALDRILMSGRYVIPVSYSPRTRLAHSADLHFPSKTPLYGDFPGFMPDTWWQEPEQ